MIDVPASNESTSPSLTEKFSGTDFSASLAAAIMLPAARLPFADTPEVITVLGLLVLTRSADRSAIATVPVLKSKSEKFTLELARRDAEFSPVALSAFSVTAISLLTA